MFDESFWRWWLAGVLVAALWFGGPRVHAAIEIDVCGTSDYDCPVKTPASNTSFGDPMGAAEIHDTTTSNKVQVPIGTTNQFQTPAGWSGGGSTVANPPATAPVTNKWTRGPQATDPNAGCIFAGNCTTPQAACDALMGLGASFWGSTPVSVTSTNNDPNTGPWGCSCDNGGGPASCGTASVTRVQECPPGYTTPVSGTCTVLATPSLVKYPSDGRCNIIRSGNLYAGDPQDPDCAVQSGTPAQQLNLSSSSGTVTAGTQEGSIKVQIDQSNGRVVVHSFIPSGANTQVTSRGGGNASGVDNVPIDGTAQGTVSGTGTLLNTNPGGLPDTPAAECGVAGKPPCTMKIDEAGTPTDSSLQAAVDSWNTERATALGEYGKFGAEYMKTELGLPFGITLPSVSCSDPTFSLPGGNLVVPMCARQADVQAVMAWLVWILGGITIFLMVREVR